jgi:polyhydroxyalkanoate synthesis regulator phasin
VESYEDFRADFRHISVSIDRARERGTLNSYEARRFSQQLQQIQYQADAQQRRGRFNPQAIEYQLGQLREEMRTARRESRYEQGNYNERR